MSRSLACAAILLLATSVHAQEDKPADKPAEFSGPQKGEKLTPFLVKGVLGDQTGKEYDLVKSAAGKPIVMVFVHERNRPAFGLASMISRYAASQKENGLAAGIVFLTSDPTEVETWAKNASVQRAYPASVPVSVSVDGQEGPGAYGLNRKMQVTVLVGKDDKVTANFALVQPSLQADGPKIVAAIAEALGIEAPSAEELEKLNGPMRRPDAPRRKAD
jgi:hypothetical protein